MKKTLIAIAAILLSVGVYAQSGSVQMNNHIVGSVEAPVTVGSTTDGAGTVNAMVQLFLVNGSTLTPVGTAINFRGATGAAAKYFQGADVDLPGTTPAGSATLRARAWVGASYDAAKASGAFNGESANFVVPSLGGGQLPAASLDALQAFAINAVTVPEPTTIALGVLGAAAMIAARRRK